jgi:predicted DNA-binding transcriptional regulator
MSKDQAVGALLVLVSIVVIVAYIWLVFFPYTVPIPGVDIAVLKLTGTVAIVVVFGILAWIGYTLATTPPPKPIEEIEKELEKELKETEKPKAEEAKPEAPEAKPEAPKA